MGEGGPAHRTSACYVIPIVPTPSFAREWLWENEYWKSSAGLRIVCRSASAQVGSRVLDASPGPAWTENRSTSIMPTSALCRPRVSMRWWARCSVVVGRRNAPVGRGWPSVAACISAAAGGRDECGRQRASGLSVDPSGLSDTELIACPDVVWMRSPDSSTRSLVGSQDRCPRRLPSMAASRS